MIYPLDLSVEDILEIDYAICFSSIHFIRYYKQSKSSLRFDKFDRFEDLLLRY
jgi:hypothetical protein